MTAGTSRTTLCWLTALALVLGSAALMAARDRVTSGPAAEAFRVCSPSALPPPERELAGFLLLMPVAALVVAAARNLIGLGSFGTFTPALLGLAFRDGGAAVGLAVLAAALFTGWRARHVLQRFHLLQVPRSAVLLTCVVCVLLGALFLAGRAGLSPGRSLSLLPLVILTGMVERFWTLEEEDGAGPALRTLVGTLLIAAAVALVARAPALGRLLMGYPEALGVLLAAQMLLGRYTGYRLLELYRFRELGDEPEPPGDV
ncbi:MAG TPA: 7TM domain-containing protein [Gemmataceae bacterium]